MQWRQTIAEFIGLPPGLPVLCGMALGYVDTAHPINSLRTERAGLAEFAQLRGFGHAAGA